MKKYLLFSCLLVACASPTENHYLIPSVDPKEETSTALPYLLPPVEYKFSDAYTASQKLVNQSCSYVGASARCSILWSFAGATTGVAIAVCAGSLGSACVASMVATGKVWIEYYKEPDCGDCPSKQGDIWHGYY